MVRDIDLLKKLGRVTVSWSINTLDENFKNDMDSASSIEHRIAAMKQVYEACLLYTSKTTFHAAQFGSPFQ